MASVWNCEIMRLLNDEQCEKDWLMRIMWVTEEEKKKKKGNQLER